VADLGIDPHRRCAGAKTRSVRKGAPSREGGARVEDPAAAAQAIIDFLVSRELV